MGVRVGVENFFSVMGVRVGVANLDKSRFVGVKVGWQNFFGMGVRVGVAKFFFD